MKSTRPNFTVRAHRTNHLPPHHHGLWETLLSLLCHYKLPQCNSGEALVCKEGEEKVKHSDAGAQKAIFSLSMTPGRDARAEFLCEWSKRYPSANMLCTSATGSICDVSAARPEIAPTGPTASSDFLRDLLGCTDTDKSPHKSGPQIPWPLIKVIRPWSAISNRRELLAAAQTLPLARGWVAYHLLANVTTDSLVSHAGNRRAPFKDDLCMIHELGSLRLFF